MDASKDMKSDEVIYETEDSSDESELGVFRFATDAIRNGDAHEQRRVNSHAHEPQRVNSQEVNESENALSRDCSVLEHKDNLTEVVDSKEDDTFLYEIEDKPQEVVIEVRDEADLDVRMQMQTDESNSEKGVQETRETDEGPEHITTDTSVKRKMARKVPQRNSENYDEQSGTTDDPTEKPDRNRPVPAPRPLRRTTGEWKPPDKYGDYVMFSAINQPYDRKMYSLQMLMESGILGDMDAEIAHRIVEAIMK